MQMSASENGCTKKQAMTYRPSTCTRGDRKVATDPPISAVQNANSGGERRVPANPLFDVPKSTAGKGAACGSNENRVKKQHNNSKVYGAITADEKARAYRLGFVQGNREGVRNPYRLRTNSRGGPMLAGMWEAGRIDAANGAPMREF